VLTRSLATTSCTLVPIVALLLFGGATLQDFAFALLVGVASGAYSSIFIASPVLTHWKERESAYRSRRHRIESDLGYVPAYAAGVADVEPERKAPRRPGRLTTPEAETVSAAEFEQMKRDLEIEQGLPSRQTSTLTNRLSRSTAEDEASAPPASPAKPPAARPTKPPPASPAAKPPPASPAKPPPASPAAKPPELSGDGAEHVPAPDIAENEGVAPVQKPKSQSKSRSRNRRHGRRR
jgi:SecD/SecF fusion protein